MISLCHQYFVPLTRKGTNCVSIRNRVSIIRHLAAVKEVSWCAPSGSPNTKRPKRTRELIGNNDEEKASLEPIARFGVVAAMSKNRVIGIAGRLPWTKDQMKEDRIAFESLTRNKILVLGRKTLFEQKEDSKCNTKEEQDPAMLLSHVSHARAVVVLSGTAESVDNLLDKCIGNVKTTQSDGGVQLPNFVLARSLPEALSEARKLEQSFRLENKESGNAAVENDCDDEISCWIAGGERIYNEALVHSSCQEVHLTIVDMGRSDCWDVAIPTTMAKSQWETLVLFSP